MLEIDREQFERQARIKSLDQSRTNKENALKRRIERIDRQQAIAELAANENKNQDEIKMQEQFLIHRLYSVFLKKKMEKEMSKYMFIEDAFQRIRTATGQSDVQEIVSKFLTREQTYNQLLCAVSENENKSDRLREEHEMLASKLHELQMEHDGDNEAQTGKKKRSEGSAFSPEIEALDKEIVALTKEKEKSDELCKKVELVNDQVQSWCSKVVQKIDS